MPAPFDVAALRSRFPALRRPHNGQPAAYFDGAAGSQVPQSVIDAVADVLTHHNANRGSAIPTSREADQRIEEAHRALADFLGATSPAEIVFGQNMTSLTFALSRTLARTWKPGDEIIVTRLDHDANVTPWTLAARDAGAIVHTVEFREVDCTLDVESLLSRLNPRTRLVAVGYASNAVGTVNPIANICRQAKAAGALTFVDAVHYAPHGRIDVAALGCDFLACSPYKFFGPHLGVMYGRLEHLERLEAYKLRPAPSQSPVKWMTGTQSHESIWGAATAVEYLASLSGESSGPRTQRLDAAFERIQAYERSIGDRLLAGLRELKRFRLWGIADSSRWNERVPTFSVTHESLSPAALCERLLEHGLFGWAGNHYALSFCERCNLEPGGTLRLSLLHYNTQEEVDRLLEALRSIDV
jgi:cysteine desulfurase family protein (TIGR01976 family)